MVVVHRAGQIFLAGPFYYVVSYTAIIIILPSAILNGPDLSGQALQPNAILIDLYYKTE